MSTPMLILGSSPLQVATNNAATASGAAVVLGPFNNAAGQTLGGYGIGNLQLVFTMASGPTAGTGIDVYVLCARDPGSDANYEDGSATGPVIPTKARAGTLLLDNGVTSYNRPLNGPILLPPGYFKLLVYNNGSGQSMAANWNAYLTPWSPGY